MTTAPNIGLQRTSIRRFAAHAAAEAGSLGPLSAAYLASLFLVAALAMACSQLNGPSAKPITTPEEEFLKSAVIQIDLPVPNTNPTKFATIELAPSQIEVIREAILAALGRHSIGGVTCSTNDFRLTFRRGSSQQESWFNCGYRWLSGGKLIRTVSFTTEESQAIEHILGPVWMPVPAKH